jgi:hypothetical protein
VYVFQNEQLITKFNCELDDLYFNIHENTIRSIYQIKKKVQLRASLESNVFQYNMWEKELANEGWFEVQHDLINEEKVVHFPYAFFIYNHDQLYLKDLRCPEEEGYFYLNNFLGIGPKERPLTVHPYNMWGSVAVNVPIIDSRYYPGSFYIRVNQFFGDPKMNMPDKFGPYLYYMVYSYNQDLKSGVSSWAHAITDDKGQLDKDVRIFYEHSCLKIEKWNKNQCFERTYVTHYT